jgi:hypothetical protein
MSENLAKILTDTAENTAPHGAEAGHVDLNYAAVNGRAPAWRGS